MKENSNSTHEYGPPFEGWDCPCGADQPDPERLYCEDCLERMAAEMARDLEDQHA